MQNVIIDIMSHDTILMEITSRVKGARFYSIMADEVTTHNVEELAMCLRYVTHLDETSHMSAEFVFRYGPKCMGGLILPYYRFLFYFIYNKFLKYVNYHMAKYHT